MIFSLIRYNHAFLKSFSNVTGDFKILIYNLCPYWKVNLARHSRCSSGSYSVFIRCFLFSRDGRIYLIPSAISRTPSLHLSRLRASSFKPTFSVSSSTCFFQVFFGRPRFLLPVTSRFRATLKTLSSSLLSTCPCPCCHSNSKPEELGLISAIA